MRILVIAVGLILTLLMMVGQTDESPAPPRGSWVFFAAGCLACHTDGKNGGSPLAGGHVFETPFGTFYSPNITSHPTQGIGGWSKEDFLRALRDGEGPNGKHYFPVFPYPSYTQMTDEDAFALFEYLKTFEPSDRKNQEHDLVWYIFTRWVNWVWKLLFLDQGPFEADPDRSLEWNRGAYLVNALAHCGECHSPRNFMGAVDKDRQFAGTNEGPNGDSVPNITPHLKDGIGEWTEADIADYLSSGMLPDGDFAGGLMVDVIDEGLSKLPADDLKAIAAYLKSLPALPSDP